MEANHRHSEINYDCIIIGSGLGGLICAAVLGKEGRKVLVLEKNDQIGGSLQTFQHDGVTFDTGVHYIGSLGKGQSLYQLFNYIGIMDRLEIEQLDPTAFDTILFKDDAVEYPFAQGYDAFIARLSAIFPQEEKGIRAYCDGIKNTCLKFPLYNISAEEQFEDLDVLQQPLRETIASFTSNRKLQNVLAGNNLLYAGEGDKTPFYVHALIVNSFIESSWRCTKGGDQIAKLLARTIRANGGEIIRKAEVARMVEDEGKLQFVELKSGEKFLAAQYISNMHPQRALEILESQFVRPAFRKRIHKLQNTTGTFVVYAEVEKGKIPYTNRNYYYLDGDDAWHPLDENLSKNSWPYNYGLFEMVPEGDKNFTEAVSIMTYMNWEEVEQWEDTFNTTVMPDERGADYEIFKNEKAQLLLEKVAIKFPGLVKHIKKFVVSTPLTYRDYLNYPEGSMYGIRKDYHEPVQTMISPNTRIENLFFTGQNIKLHGILGVAISAFVTCNVILGREYLVKKIRDVNSL